MKSTTLALASLLASAVSAQPHRQHQHQHVKKDVVWFTDWVSVTQTVGYTTTVWVDEGFVPPTGAASQPSSSSVSVASSTPTQAGAQFYQPPSQASSSSSSAVSITSPAAAVAPPVVPVQAPPQVQSSSSVYVPPTTTSSAYTAPASTSAATPASQSASSSGGSHGGQVPTSPQPGSGYNGIGTGQVNPTCGIAGAPDCEGDITYYEAADDPNAPGACGITNDGTTELVVAVPVGMMGSQSNSGKGEDANPYCGKTVTIEYGGKSVVATVVDKCDSCQYEDLDLSHAAFAALTPNWQTLGRQKGQWYFN
jgi:hypothetical protein